MSTIIIHKLVGGYAVAAAKTRLNANASHHTRFNNTVVTGTLLRLMGSDGYLSQTRAT